MLRDNVPAYGAVKPQLGPQLLVPLRLLYKLVGDLGIG
jgi:hypothetical protein